MTSTTPKFGALAVVTDEFVMTPEERLRYGLTNPGAQHTLSLAKTDRITTSRIRYALSELVNLNLDEIQAALQELRKQSPKVYIDTMIELMQFSLPKLKAVSVSVDDGTANPQKMSMSDLMRVVSEQ